MSKVITLNKYDQSLRNCNKMHFNINICLLGNLAVGKTTFVQTLLSDVKQSTPIRSTIYPQIYRTVHKFKKLTNQLDGVFMTIHDIPGLNNANTKNRYTRYVQNNFSRYDIILYMIDVTTGLNTSDEIETLNLILEQLKQNQKNGLVQKLIVVINKCENYDVDTEIQEMYQQVKTTIKNKIQNKQLDPTFFPLACENAYAYYMTIHQPTITLDMNIYDRIGINQFGKKKWNNIKGDKSIFIKNAIINGDIDLESGFENIIGYISNYLGETNYQNQYLILQNRIKSSWIKLITYVNRMCLVNKWFILSIKRQVLEKNIWRILHYSIVLHLSCDGIDSSKSTLTLFTKYLEQYLDAYISSMENIPMEYLIIVNDHLERIFYASQKMTLLNDAIVMTKMKILVSQIIKHIPLSISHVIDLLNQDYQKYSHGLISKKSMDYPQVLFYWFFRMFNIRI